MNEILKYTLLLALAASGVTLAGSAWRYWFDEERRLRLYVLRSLGGPVDGQVVAKGRGAAAAFSMTTRKIVVLWNGGANALLYPIAALMGAELVVDGAVAARVYRSEPRKILDQISGGAGQVTLRLVFDNPRDPEFEIDLWLPEDEARRDGRSAAGAIREGRTWIARADAILRAPPQARSHPYYPIDDEPRRREDHIQEDEEEDDDAPF